MAYHPVCRTIRSPPAACTAEVLFAVVHLRGLQLTPAVPDGRPPAWIEMCLYHCVNGLLAQTVLTVVSAIHAELAPKPRLEQMDVVAAPTMSPATVVLTVLRWMALLCVYSMMLAIVGGLLLQEVTDSEEDATPPLSATMTSVLVLTMQYFAVHLLLFVAFTMDQVRSTKTELIGERALQSPMRSIMETLVAAKDTVMFAPMMGVLFLGTHVRAMQIDHKAMPQKWVQDGMYVCMWAALVQLFLVVLTGLVTGVPVRAHPTTVANAVTGSARTDDRQEAKAAAFVWAIVQFVCLACILAGVIGVIAGTFSMSADNVTYAGDS